jgi:hypothetical protein
MDAQLVKELSPWMRSWLRNFLHAHLLFFSISVILSNVLQPYPWAHDQGKGLQGREPRGVGESVRMKTHDSQVSSHFRSWSSDGLPNLQRAIAKVKTSCIEEFFISLESY